MRVLTRGAVAGALSVLVILAAPGAAAAGQYSVAACQADQLGFSTRAFVDFATRGMSIRRACNPEGPGLRGLITANVVRRRPLPRGSVSLLSISAPPGTRFTTFTWAGTARRVDCRFALQVWADVPGTDHRVKIKNVRANQHCPRKRRAQQAGYRARTFNVAGTTRIGQRVICMGGHGRNSCSARGVNFLRTYKAQVGVVDGAPPTVAIAADTPLARGAWVGASQPLNYNATDNVGVRSAQAVVGDRSGGTHERPCSLAAPVGPYSDVVPCPNGPGQIGVNTRELLEGTHSLIVQVYDAAGNVGRSTSVTARIDNSAPGRVDTAVEGGEQWRNRNDFVVSWANPAEGDQAPIVAARYKLCPVGPGTCAVGEAAGANLSRLGLQVPAQGEWALSLWRRDAAGNESEAVASVPVSLRYDVEPPRLGFAQQSTADPTAVAVSVADNASGVAEGAIEISRQGSGIWQMLQTTRAGDRLVARIDDATLPAGTYLMRAHARDQAGNEASTMSRSDGQPMVLNLPVRIASTMRAGIAHTKLVRRWVRRHGKRLRIRRRVTVLRRSAPVAFGGRAEIRGRLTDRNGHGIAGAPIQVLSRSSVVNAERLEAAVRTGDGGRFRYTAAGTMSRTLRLAFAGSPLVLPTQGEVTVRVPAAGSLKAKRRHLVNGQVAQFSGVVRSVPLPAGGKLVELQVRLSGRWQTFRTRRSDSAGRWAIPYRFRRTTGVQRYRFRLRLPSEAGYPFATGTSRTLVVTVRGR
jgi:hypothetical protein